MKLGQAISKLQERFDPDGSGHFIAIGNELRRAGKVRSDGRRGVNAPNVDFDDGAAFVLAKLASDRPSLAAAAVDDLGGMVAEPFDVAEGLPPETALLCRRLGIVAGMPLKEAVARIISVMGLAGPFADRIGGPFEIEMSTGSFNVGEDTYHSQRVVTLTVNRQAYRFTNAARLSAFTYDGFDATPEHQAEIDRFDRYGDGMVEVCRKIGHTALYWVGICFKPENADG